MSIESDVLSYRIPRGYMIVCSSWENDGDHFKTNVVGGLTKEYRDNATVLSSMATLNNDEAGTLEKLTARNNCGRTTSDRSVML